MPLTSVSQRNGDFVPESKHVCLLGNGASISYNPDLAVPALTTGIAAAYMESTGLDDPDEVRRNLGEFAAAIRRRGTDATDSAGFEELLGPLDAAARALPNLRRLISATGGRSRDSLEQTIADIERIHRFGKSVALELIATRAQNVPESFDRAVLPFCDAVTELAHPGNITVATLNYDGLAHAGLLHALRPEASGWVRTDGSRFLTDLAAGYGERDHSPAGPEGPILLGHPLRTEDDVLRDRLFLCQLHGSLSWLRDPDTGLVWSFELQDLREADYWQRWRDGRTDWAPEVLLTDQKEAGVLQDPFDLAYLLFRERLIEADRWLVAGYGWADAPVNDVLHTAAKLRVSRYGPAHAPRVLAVDIGEGAAYTERLRGDISARLDINRDRVSVEITGVPACVESEKWNAWAN